MAYCPDCGEQVSPGALFCSSCGTELEGSQSESSPEETAVDAPDGFEKRHAGLATAFAILPAFGVYVLISFANYKAIPLAFVVALPIFAYLMYRKATKKSMASGMFFWLAVESFLTPLAAILYTSSYAEAETQTAAGAAGAAIGGGIVTIFTFIIGVSIGVVFYLISRRLEPDWA